MSDELKPYDEKAAQARRLAILSELAQSRIGDSLKTPAVSAQYPHRHRRRHPRSKTTDSHRSLARAKDGSPRIWWILPIRSSFFRARLRRTLSGRSTAQSRQPQQVDRANGHLAGGQRAFCPRGAASSPDGKKSPSSATRIAAPAASRTSSSTTPACSRSTTRPRRARRRYELDDAIQPKLGLLRARRAESRGDLL